jgi:hypothetical protein
MNKDEQASLISEVSNMANDAGDGQSLGQFFCDMLSNVLGFTVTLPDLEIAVKILLERGEIVQDKYGSIIGTQCYPNTAERVRQGLSICGPD